MQLIVCRHTQTDDDVAGRLSGQKDVPLNTNGMVQVIEVATRVVACHPRVRAVVCSDAARARVLGEAIAQRSEGSMVVEAHYTDALREVNLGRASGLTAAQVKAQYCHSTHYPGFNLADIGGESWAQVVERQLHAVEWLRLAFNHAGVNPRLDSIVRLKNKTRRLP